MLICVVGCDATAQVGLGHLIVEVSRTHVIRHTHTPRSTALNEWSARRRGLYVHNTKDNIHAQRGNRTRSPSNQAVANLMFLRPHRHRDWRYTA